jgi:two-component system, chemotaxis family, sensor kinase CheA
MFDEPLNQKLLNLFATEAKEAVQSMVQSCLLLEKTSDEKQRAEQIRIILRHTHSLKGSARSLGLDDIARLTHSLESLFQSVQKIGYEIDKALFDLIYQALDAISSLASGAQPIGISLENLSERLETAAENDSKPQKAIFRPGTPENTLSGSEKPAGQETIRIRVERLDAIFDLVTELQVTQLSMERTLAGMHALIYDPQPTAMPFDIMQQRTQFADLLRNSEANCRNYSHLVSRLHEQVRQARMLPLSTILKPLQRTARDLGRVLGKEVILHIEGEDIELDRSVIEQIKMPLQHLLNNSIDHGLEPPEKRRAAGKSEIGNIIIRTIQNGSSILIEFRDDGAGIKLESVKEHAVQHGLVTGHEAAQLQDQEILRLLFKPDFSMARSISSISGRGIGLDIVRQAVEAMQGEIVVENDPGKGVCFSLNIPVNIATTLCLFVQIQDQIFALPTRSVIRLARMHPENVTGTNPAVLVVGSEAEPIPAVSLRHLIQPDHQPENSGNQRAVIVGSPDRPVALLVDDLHDVQEIIIRQLPLFFTHIPWLSGAAISSSGEVILVLNTLELARAAARRDETKGARQ